jgi:hypothetical protein
MITSRTMGAADQFDDETGSPVRAAGDVNVRKLPRGLPGNLTMRGTAEVRRCSMAALGGWVVVCILGD